jgi:Tfp pilus assembly protein PilP
VKNGMVIGLHKGVIKSITDSALVVRERLTNVLGDLENQDTVLKLPAESKTDVKTITSEQGW